MAKTPEPTKIEMAKLKTDYEKKTDAQRKKLQEQWYVNEGLSDYEIRVRHTGLGPSAQPTERKRLGIATKERGRPAKDTTTKATPTKKASARKPGSDLRSRYVEGDDKDKAKILSDLRDGAQLSWRNAGEKIGLSPTAMRGAYSRLVRPHTESVVFPGVGRKPNAAKKAEPKKAAARKAPAAKKAAKRQPAKRATAQQPKAETA